MDKKRLIIGSLWGRRPPKRRHTKEAEVDHEPRRPRPLGVPDAAGQGRPRRPPPRPLGPSGPSLLLRRSPAGIAFGAHFEVRRGLMRGSLGRGEAPWADKGPRALRPLSPEPRRGFP